MSYSFKKLNKASSATTTVGNVSFYKLSDQSASDPIYGVSWVNDTTTTMTRTDNSVGKSYSINTTNGTIQSDFDNLFPWNETTIVTDSNSNVFVHFPDMYFRIGKDANGDINSVAVSKTAGATGDWYLCSSFDYGCYGGSFASGASYLESKSGKTKVNTQPRGTFRDYAGLNAIQGYDYTLLDLKHKTVLMFLWWIEWATKNSSSIMSGHIGGTTTDTNTQLQTGGTDSFTTPSGYNTSNLQMRYHYIEDFIGNGAEFVDGIFTGTTTSPDYVTANPAYFSDNTNNKSALSWNDPANGCIMAFGMDNDKPFLVMPSKTTGDTDYTVAFCDGLGNQTSSSQSGVLYCGASFKSNNEIFGVCRYIRGKNSTALDVLGARLIRQPNNN